MKDKKFEVQIYYTGFCTYQVDAYNEDEAIERTRELSINDNEILNNLENWKEADTAEEIKYEDSRK